MVSITCGPDAGEGIDARRILAHDVYRAHAVSIVVVPAGLDERARARVSKRIVLAVEASARFRGATSCVRGGVWLAVLEIFTA